MSQSRALPTVMRALMLESEGPRLTTCPVPGPPPGEALIRVTMAGVCATDVELIKGYMQFQGVLGHEFVGIVVAAPGAEAWEGQRVVGDINAACGTCPTCIAGRPTHCPNRTTLGIQGRDGAFAEYLTLPLRNLVAVPAAIPDTQAVFTEPLAAACEILEQIHVRPTQRVIVLGDGKLGLLCAQVLALTGCDLTVVGHHAEKLAIVEHLGIPVALDDKALGFEADVVVEATGHPEGYAAACRLVRPRGTLVLKSTYHGEVQADLTMAVVDEIRMIGSRCGPFAPALRLLARGWVDVESLIETHYPLESAPQALRHAMQPGALKVLIDMPT